MPQGLQVFDASGNVILDIGNRVVKGIVVESVIESGSETITISPDSTSSIYVAPVSDDEQAPTPTITTSGSSVTVTWGSDGRGSSYARDILIMEF